MEGGGEQGGVHHYEIRGAVNFLRRSHPHRQIAYILLLDKRIAGNDMHVEGRELLYHQSGDLPHTDNAHRSVLQLHGLVSIALGKAAVPGQLVHADDPLAQRQQQRYNVFCHGIHVGIRSIHD